MQKSVLVVEDDPAITAVLREILEGEHYEVETAPDGAYAFNSLRRRRFDIVLCDLRMPILGGLGLYQLLTEHTELRPRHFLFMTATPRDLEGASIPLVKHVISKPFDVGELTAVLERLS